MSMVLATTNFPPHIRVPDGCLGRLCSLTADPTKTEMVFFGPLARIQEIQGSFISDTVRVWSGPTEQSVVEAVRNGTASLGLPINSGVFTPLNSSFSSAQFLDSPTVIVWYSSEIIQPLASVLQTLVATWPYFFALFVGCLFAGLIVSLLEPLSDHWEPKRLVFGLPERVMKGFWWAFITASTVGYGDKVVTKMGSRIFAFFWMICGILLVTMMIGDFTGNLSSMSMLSATDWLLSSKSLVGVRVHSRAHIYAAHAGLNVVTYDTYADLCRDVRDREIGAAVLDTKWAADCAVSVGGGDVFAFATTPVKEKYNLVYNAGEKAEAHVTLLKTLLYVSTHPSKMILGDSTEPIVPATSTPFQLENKSQLAASLLLLTVCSGIAAVLNAVGYLLKRLMSRSPAPEEPVTPDGTEFAPLPGVGSGPRPIRMEGFSELQPSQALSHSSELLEPQPLAAPPQLISMAPSPSGARQSPLNDLTANSNGSKSGAKDSSRLELERSAEDVFGRADAGRRDIQHRPSNDRAATSSGGRDSGLPATTQRTGDVRGRGPVQGTYRDRSTSRRSTSPQPDPGGRPPSPRLVSRDHSSADARPRRETDRERERE
eukprot:CAMPEP_0114546450 /NCGR_PEP_ID=MMETSP0114-20121206/3941_1 /TAXON_ID=31324 /ORGANISM="Goniomonas sp, Strain m" /LENGTH=599 /DNA_ID=CAMNT_0001730947 /DNA_START=8 /DNA_END=1804 /DNA_ORIENTATION=+